MEAALLEVARQVPALVVLAYLVYRQDANARARDVAFIGAMKERDDRLALQATACHAEASAGRAAITESTKALTRFDSALEDGGCLEQTIRRAVREELRPAG